jgi:hypothetical protein
MSDVHHLLTHKIENLKGIIAVERFLVFEIDETGSGIGIEFNPIVGIAIHGFLLGEARTHAENQNSYGNQDTSHDIKIGIYSKRNQFPS